jgi:hypothetical protein
VNFVAVHVETKGELTAGGLAWYLPGVATPQRYRALLVVSRETGANLAPAQLLAESVVLGLRWALLHQNPNSFREIGAFHVQNQSSMRHVPATPSGATAHKWALFNDFFGRQVIGTEVQILVRGIDGLTTARGGLLGLIAQYPNLNLTFIFTQRSKSTYFPFFTLHRLYILYRLSREFFQILTAVWAVATRCLVVSTRS